MLFCRWLLSQVGGMSQVRGHLLLAGGGQEMSLESFLLCNLESAEYSLSKRHMEEHI